MFVANFDDFRTPPTSLMFACHSERVYRRVFIDARPRTLRTRFANNMPTYTWFDLRTDPQTQGETIRCTLPHEERILCFVVNCSLPAFNESALCSTVTHLPHAAQLLVQVIALQDSGSMSDRAVRRALRTISESNGLRSLLRISKERLLAPPPRPLATVTVASLP